MTLPDSALARRFLTQVTRIANKLKALDRETLDFGTGDRLHPFEINLIDVIGHDEARTVGALAAWFHVTPGAVSQAVGGLARLGYLDRQRNPANQREIRLTLTGKGQTAFAAHAAFHEQMDARLWEGLADVPPDQIVALADLLARVDGQVHHYLAFHRDRRRSAR